MDRVEEEGKTEKEAERLELDVAHLAVLKPSNEGILTEKLEVKGYDFNNGIEYEEILNSYFKMGFQATNYARAVSEINRMINWGEDNEFTGERCKIFLGYTSNMVTSGLRETFRYLVEHKMVDVIVTTAGGIEEDLIKCLGDTYVASFDLDGSKLRENGLNRAGNLVIPNENYCKFEKWIGKILDRMVDEQENQNTSWTPMTVIHRLGKEINNRESIYYWAYKNNIPVYCPALTDGSLGDMIYFHSYRKPGLKIDICADIKSINSQAVYAKKTGIIILGSGLVKHHICNANLMRNGADFCVYINNAQEFDGSDAGASPDEAVSWGKIKAGSTSVKLFCDATLIFPLIVAQTFAASREIKKDVNRWCTRHY